MPQLYKIVSGLLCLLLLSFNVNAQVSLNIALLSDGSTYEVSLLPEESWSGVEALTATAQVTLVVPTGGFELDDFENVTGTWLSNATIKAPVENPNYDYYNIGLASLGTDAIPYIEDEAVVLFRFENSGDCVGTISLMEENDPFGVPNSLSTNVGNQLTTLGSGNVNAWKGNYGSGANCGIPSAITEGDVNFVIELLEDNETYQVSVEPNQDWTGIHKLTSTAQVTLVVPAGGFELVDLYSVNGDWLNNATIFTPTENPDYDYINVGLTSLGTDAIAYAKNEKTTLFTFKNGGICTGTIELMEANDVFAAPNSMSANVGNQLTTLGSGNKNAWTGNKGVGTAHCEECDQTDFIETCTGPIEPVIICIELCDASKAITQVTSSYECSLSILENNCIRYTPSSGFETVGLDYLTIQACDNSGNCETVNTEVKVSTNCANDDTIVNGGSQEAAITEAARLDPSYSTEEWEAFLGSLVLPTVMTPNSDGINDVLTIKNLEVLPLNYTVSLTVFDRNGGHIYQDANYTGSNSWAGKLNNGTKNVNEGTYFYKFAISNTVETLYTTFKYLEVRN